MNVVSVNQTTDRRTQALGIKTAYGFDPGLALRQGSPIALRAKSQGSRDPNASYANGNTIHGLSVWRVAAAVYCILKAIIHQASTVVISAIASPRQ
jgi:hypothetical protein